MLVLNVLLVSVTKILIIFLPCPLYFMALLHFKAFKLIFVIFFYFNAIVKIKLESLLHRNFNFPCNINENVV